MPPGRKSSDKGFDTRILLWQVPALHRAGASLSGSKVCHERNVRPMAKEEWGTKRVCPTTGKRFYDLNRSPIISPYTGEVVTLDTGRGRTMITERVKPGADLDDEPAVLEDDEADGNDVDLGDEILEDDEDENVSLDDLTDVASDDDV